MLSILLAFFLIQINAQELPEKLSDTGLYENIERHQVGEGNFSFSPQYPLWSDGAVKNRWIYLPPGQKIDSTNLDEWQFPIGTKVWKEFIFGDKRVETRMIQRLTDGQWAFATYLWTADEKEAHKAPVSGLANYWPIAPGKKHDIPGVQDCRSCHQQGQMKLLGFNALQLSPDRDPLAPHAGPLRPGMIHLMDLVKAGVLTRNDPQWATHPPRILARNATSRAAIGYLATNCGSCHRPEGILESLGLFLNYPLDTQVGKEPVALTAFNRPARYQIPELPLGETFRIQPGDVIHSAVVYRMSKRTLAAKMPPLGSKIVDEEGLALIRQWITQSF